MQLVKNANALLLTVLLVGFGATAWAATPSNNPNLHEISGEVLILTPDNMQVGTSQGIVDLKITKDSHIDSSVVQGDYVDLWYEAQPDNGNVVVNYSKSMKQPQQRSSQMGTSSATSSSNSGSSSSNNNAMQGNSMQGTQPSTTSRPAMNNQVTGTSSPQASQPSQSAGHAMKTLPHTASDLPLIGLAGLLALAGATGLTVIRLRG